MIIKEDGALAYKYCINLEIASNNVADALAYEIRLKMAIKQHIWHLHIYGNSAPIKNALSKEKKVNWDSRLDKSRV